MFMLNFNCTTILYLIVDFHSTHLNTCAWYSITGHSSNSDGPNCFLTAQYRIAMVIATDVKFEHNDVIVIRPEDNAPKDAPTQIQLLVFKLLLKSS